MNNDQILRLAKAKEYAQNKGGDCLSTEYVNAKTKMKWKCSHGHEWESTFSVIVTQEKWCPKCKYLFPSEKSKIINSKKDFLQKMKQHAINLGGECLSDNYINKNTKLIWKCSHGHNWESTPFSITIAKTWCPQCAINNSKKIDEKLKLAKQHAIVKGGECLSKKYISANDKLEWKCSNKNHSSWFAKLKNVVFQDQWCPECSNKKFKTENRVRLIFETFFNEKFPSVRLDWLKNPLTGKNLELDGYCDKLKIAFEHDGQHHFNIVSYSKKLTQDTLNKQIQNDILKKEKCVTHGVILINIPILPYNLRYKFFPLLKHVINCSKKQNIFMFFTLSQIRKMKNKFYQIL